MAKTGTTIKKTNVKTKKPSHYTKDDCVKEIARLIECKQNNSKYFDNIMERAKKLGIE